jgi:FAD/FMN-containing dehydrogenase
VTADGEILTLSEKENRDLFWACRGGGGGNFGISTSFSVRTVRAPSFVTASRVTWTKKIDRVVPALLAALYESPVSLGTWTTLDAVTPKQRAEGKDVSVFFEGQLLGTPADLRRILAPAYAVEKPSDSRVKEMSYWKAQTTFFSDVEQPTEFQNRGLYFCGQISHKAIDIMLHWLRRWPGTSIYARVSLLRTGGRANAVAAPETAFVHRDNEWYLLWYLKWDKKDSKALVAENLAWLHDFYDAMAPYALPQTYQNFTDPSLDDYLLQYYGSNLPRLKRIKAAVDPARVFNFPQAIPPAHHHRCP